MDAAQPSTFRLLPTILFQLQLISLKYIQVLQGESGPSTPGADAMRLRALKHFIANLSQLEHQSCC